MELTDVIANTDKPSELSAEYSPSWVDRLTARIRKIPVPSWLIYLFAGLSLSFIRTLTAWGDGSYPVGTFFHIHIQDGLASVYLLLVLHYLDNRANSAIASFRPALNVNAEGYEKLRYQITTMPARPVFILSTIGLIFGLLFLPFVDSPTDLEASKYFSSPLAIVIDTLTAVIQWVTNVVFAYHTFRQLRLVSRIYTQHTKVSIFDTGPLYALSRVSAATAISLLGLVYFYIVFYGNGELDTIAASGVNGIIGGAFILVALVTFIGPLYGAHKLLQDEKERRRGDIARRIEATADDAHSKTDARNYADMSGINDAIDVLVKEHGLVAKASTWPWDPEALRAVISALLLPVLIWVITRLLERSGI